MKNKDVLISGFKAMLPVTTGVFPFGAVMGTVAADAQLSFIQSFLMNFFVFAGASQLAAVDLMTKNAAILVVLLTGLIINLRFILYSAAMSPLVQKSSWLVKLSSSYFLTDQSYAVMSAHQSRFKNDQEAVLFYFGSCLCMTLAWHLSVGLGFLFGNIAPAGLALDYAVPLSFVALVIPTLKNRKYIYVAVFSSVVSVLLYELPLKTGLIATALLSLVLVTWLTKKTGVRL